MASVDLLASASLITNQCSAPIIGASSQIDSFSIISMNLHDLKQGLPVLNHLAEIPDPTAFILTQESWLTPANLYKLNNFSSVYSGFGVSAMEKAVNNGILRGRPYGGVSTLVKADLCKFVSQVKCRERFVILNF